MNVDWILEDAAYTDGVQPQTHGKIQPKRAPFFEGEGAAEDEEEEEDWTRRERAPRLSRDHRFLRICITCVGKDSRT